MDKELEQEYDNLDKKIDDLMTEAESLMQQKIKGLKHYKVKFMISGELETYAKDEDRAIDSVLEETLSKYPYKIESIEVEEME